MQIAGEGGKLPEHFPQAELPFVAGSGTQKLCALAPRSQEIDHTSL